MNNTAAAQQAQAWAAQTPTTPPAPTPPAPAATAAPPDKDISALRAAPPQHIFSFRGNYDAHGVPPLPPPRSRPALRVRPAGNPPRARRVPVRGEKAAQPRG